MIRNRNYKGKKCPKCNKDVSVGSKSGFCKKHQYHTLHSKNPESIERIRQSKLGKNNPSFGKKPTLESRIRHSLRMRGDKNPAWKGGRNSLNKTLRRSFKFSDWREEVFKRDDYRCQWCQQRGGPLHPHHEIHFANLLETYKINTVEQAYACKELWDVDNGITYCKKCHQSIHNLKLPENLSKIISMTSLFQTLTPSQELIARDTHRFRVVRAGRRFGKTVLASLEIVAKAYSKESNIIYVATTYQQARDIAWNTLKSIADPIALTINESRLEIKVKNVAGTTSTITLRGWENIDTLRGQKLDFAVLDEVASMRNFWENWMEVIRPTLTDNKGEVMFISTPKGFNHFYDLYNLEGIDHDYKSFHFTSYDNPMINDLEVELSKARAEMTDDRFSQEYLADFRKTEGLVYKEFTREKCLFDDNTRIYDEVEKLGGVDFGFTNPTAIPTIIKDYRGHFWQTDEFYKTGQTDMQVAEYVAACDFNKVYPDPESPSGIKELRNKGVNIREVIKNKDSIVNGINKVKELLKAGKYHVHKRCINTIQEFETYSYQDKKDQKNYNEVPIDENNHMMDAIRYVIMMQPNLDGSRRINKTYIPTGLNREPRYKI